MTRHVGRQFACIGTHLGLLVLFLGALAFTGSAFAVADNGALDGLALVSGNAAAGAGGGAALAKGGGGSAEAVAGYTVSGRVKTRLNESISGVVLGGLPGDPVTGSDGQYTATVTAGWSGTVTPSKTGWLFFPENRSYSNVHANQLYQDFGAEQVGAIRIHVDASNLFGPWTGHTWEEAFRTIQEGIDAAFNAGGGEVWVAGNTYTSTDDPVVALREGVDVYGGFYGLETDFDMRDWTGYPTIIDGEDARRCVLGANNAALDGFHIVRGRANAGAGMYNNAASPTVANCIFEDNAVDAAVLKLVGGAGSGGGGGAAGAAGGGSALAVIPYNTGVGGGMCNDASDPEISNCAFSGNVAGDGGAIYNFYAQPLVTSCTFYDNAAVTLPGAATACAGGGICNNESAPSILDCEFSHNGAGDGGAIYNRSASPNVTNCTFWGNYATIRLISGAKGGGGGGAAATGGGGAALSVLSYSTGTGGGMYNNGSSPTVMNCSFTANNAVNGGAVYDKDSALAIANGILWGDVPNEIVNSGQGAASVNFSDVQGGYSGTSNINSDPLFQGASSGNLRVQAGSPCVDHGTPAGAPGADILGVSRPQGSGYDMGAYER